MSSTSTAPWNTAQLRPTAACWENEFPTLQGVIALLQEKFLLVWVSISSPHEISLSGILTLSDSWLRPPGLLTHQIHSHWIHWSLSQRHDPIDKEAVFPGSHRFTEELLSINQPFKSVYKCRFHWIKGVYFQFKAYNAVSRTWTTRGSFDEALFFSHDSFYPIFTAKSFSTAPSL